MKAPTLIYDSTNKPVFFESIEGTFEVSEGYYVESALYEDGTEVPEKELYYIQDFYAQLLYDEAYQDYVSAAEAYWDAHEDR